MVRSFFSSPAAPDGSCRSSSHGAKCWQAASVPVASKYPHLHTSSCPNNLGQGGRNVGNLLHEPGVMGSAIEDFEIKDACQLVPYS